MEKLIETQHSSGSISCRIELPASKSESNRALIIQALSGNKTKVKNLSSARDTQTLSKLLKSEDFVADVIDAGTTFRFLTAFYCATSQHKLLTGSSRMKERPVEVLVEALKTLGFDIIYKEKQGYPPVEILPSDKTKIKSRVTLKGDVSSQYISALLMIAPCLPKGLFIEIAGEVASRPYIEMTLKMMSDFGVQYEWNDNVIHVPAQQYTAGEFYVESDWSAASYWYSIAALSKNADIELVGLKKNSLQGDSAIAAIMEPFGVITEYRENSIVIKKIKEVRDTDLGTLDFNKVPDLAQTIAALCVSKNIQMNFTGLHSLRIKETDRVLALQQELKKINGTLTETEPGIFRVEGNFRLPSEPFKTYEDHRMAMAFAPAGMLGSVQIENPGVVVKSYPHFWNDLSVAGFSVKEK